MEGYPTLAMFCSTCAGSGVITRPGMHGGGVEEPCPDCSEEAGGEPGEPRSAQQGEGGPRDQAPRSRAKGD